MLKSKLLRLKELYGLEIFVFLMIAMLLIGYVTSMPRFHTRFYVTYIRQSYNGRIIERYVEHTSIIKIRSSNEIIRISEIADDFWNIAKVGDSVSKPQNMNYVYLFKKDTVLRLHYLWVPLDVLNSGAWPPDLKYE
jgi:hypothetical protein